MDKKIYFCLTAAVSFLLLAGCYHPISKNLRQEAADITYSQAMENPTTYTGSVVIWGGNIIQTVNLPGATDIFIMDMPLGQQEKPENVKESPGAFVARSQKFLDPAIFKKGRKVTVAGRLEGKETAQVQGTERTYPIVQAQEIHLWQPEEFPPYAYNPWNWGFYPYGPTVWPYTEGTGKTAEEQDVD